MLFQLLKTAKFYLSNKKGQGMVEYALIIALIAIVVIGAVTALGGSLDGIFTNIGEQLGGSGAEAPAQ